MTAERSLDVEELRAFCAAAELGGIGRAAVRLRITQPAVSKRLGRLEGHIGVTLLERSPHGVSLTVAGRRLYDDAKRALDAVDRVAEVVSGIARTGGPIRLAASHSAAAAILSDVLGRPSGLDGLRVELATANSTVVRDMVADGRADVGLAASRPGHTPYPGVRERLLARDEVVLAVPDSHPWALRDSVSAGEFARTPVVVRDSGSNSRWTVDAVLRDRGIALAEPVAEVGTPDAAMRVARVERAPVLLGRAVLHGHGFRPLRIDGLSFPREYVLVLPAAGEPAADVVRLMAVLDAWASDRGLRPAS